MIPQRIQRKRTKGWRMPPNTVCVTRPSVFGNPFKWQKAKEAGYRGTDDQLRQFAVEIFREWLTNNNRFGHGDEARRQKLLARMHELRGKNLACFCPVGRCCHADVLMQVVNDPMTYDAVMGQYTNGKDGAK